VFIKKNLVERSPANADPRQSKQASSEVPAKLAKTSLTGDRAEQSEKSPAQDTKARREAFADKFINPLASNPLLRDAK
jgi:hypothetical protein